MAAPPASRPGGNRPRAMWRAEVVRFWEELIDNNPDVAEELFFDALLAEARAEQARRAWMGPEHGQVVGKDDDVEEEQRRARVFQPWAPSAPSSALPPPPVNRAVVLGLRAPPHLASKHGRMTPSAPAAGPRRHPEHVKKPPGA